MSYLMGIDISTTAAKALIISPNGAVVSSHATALSLSSPYPLWSEQDPTDWWDAIVQSIQQAIQSSGVDPAAIRGIGLTGQMHGLVMLDKAGNVLRPAILWNDQRTQAQCDAITDRIGFETLITLTGNRALTGFTAPKILWVREHEPDIYQRCAHILLPKDYVRYKLSNEYATDLAGAAGTSLLNVAERAWSQQVLDALDIPVDWLPKTHEGVEVTGVVSTQAAALTGLQAGTPIVGGGGDQAAGAVGMGCVEPNLVGVTVGTSGVVFAPLSEYAYEPEGRLHAFCHAVPDMWHFMGVMLSAAGSLQWYRDSLAPGETFDALMEESLEAPAGSDGLYFLPYLTGERTPHPDPYARGGFVGLTSRHRRAHLTRAVLEGVAYGLKDSFSLIARVGIPDNLEIRVSGGGAQSLAWRQILADTLDAPLVSVNTTEGGAFGAALLAGVGGGVFSDIQTACKEALVTGEVVEPGDDVRAYQERYDGYRKLYPALKASFEAISRLD